MSSEQGGDRESYVDVGGARSEDQRLVMEKIRDEGVCPFCPEHFNTYDQTEILWRGQYWMTKPNQWPYAHTSVHLVVLTINHAERLADVTPEMWQELGVALQWVEEEYRITSGAYVMRFGEIGYNGGTVAHLHLHIIVGDQGAADFETVRVKVAQRVPTKKHPG